MGFENPVVGGTALRIPAIQSPNYSPGATGWIVKINGDAEFNNLDVRGTFNGQDFIMNASGLFIYDGTPAAGNLVASIAAAAGTDSFGNTYLAGIVTYAGQGFVSLNVGNLELGLTSDEAHAGLVSLIGTNAIQANSPTTASRTDMATWELVNGLTTVTPTTDAGYPHFDVGAGTNGVTQWLHGALVYATANGGVSTAETWQTPSLGSGWASGPSGGSFRGLRYRRDGEDNLILSGTVHSTSTTPSATLFTLPTGYRPAAGERPGVIFNKGGTYSSGSLQISTAGVCTIDPVPTVASQDAYIYACVPRGNIG